jgi:CRP-like cAMP-binding protein/flavin-dependent dehydrogenase
MSSGAAYDLGRNELAYRFGSESPQFALSDGSRVAVIGGGPAGSLFAYFVRRLADSIDLDVRVEVFEPRFFTHRGPGGCNHCGGIVSESLVQLLATEGINLPPGVVRWGIESYMLHTDVGGVRIETPGHEKRIASVFRGNGPRESGVLDVGGFDQFLLDLSSSVGATVVRKLVTGMRWSWEGRPELLTPEGAVGPYDLVAVAVGVNSRLLNMFGDATPDYQPPGALRTFICEFDLGEDSVRQCLGDSMHVFLLDIPRLEFAALIPKGSCITLCLLGEDVDEALVERFLASAEVAACFPGSLVPKPACRCFPRINTRPAVRPFADRVVWIGDASVSRLYKDGIGSAYRTAKAAAKTAVFRGIAAKDFERYFWPECRALIVDNAIAKIVFGVTTLIQKLRFVRRGVLRMTTAEQAGSGTEKAMSSVLWDVFTGSAPYREVLLRTLRPSFPATLAWNLIAANASGRIAEKRKERMSTEGLGKVYSDRQVIVRQGDAGDRMFAIQAGRVEVVRETADGEVHLTVLNPGDIFGEMAIFDKEGRSATVRALGEARVLTIDKKTFLRRMEEDPSLAFNVAHTLCGRVRRLNAEVAMLRYLVAKQRAGAASPQAEKALDRRNGR